MGCLFQGFRVYTLVPKGRLLRAGDYCATQQYETVAPAREEITGLFLRRDWSFVLQTDFNSLPASERVGAGRA